MWSKEGKLETSANEIAQQSFSILGTDTYTTEDTRRGKNDDTNRGNDPGEDALQEPGESSKP